MPSRDWLEIKLRIDGRAADAAVNLMEQLGALGVTMQDAEDNPIFEPSPSKLKLWPHTIVTGLFDKHADENALVNTITAILGDNIPVKIVDLEDQDWVRAWMDSFKPIKCADNLWICPSWCERPITDAAMVILDPGLAFGTGTHPTTFLCLKKLASWNLTGSLFIDYGCGSGILSIAALKLGARHACGIDIDEQALTASKDNAQRNGVADKLKLFNALKAIPDIKAPFVAANILAGPLIDLENTIASLCEPDGNLALSGILEEQADEVIAAYEGHFKLKERIVLEGWVLLTFTKK